MTVPSLAQLLAMSNAIHLYHYYAKAYHDSGDPIHAWKSAIKLGWLPTIAAAVSTIVGFAALMICNLDVASDFAFYGGISVGISAITVLIGMPTCLLLIQPRPKPTGKVELGMIRFLDKFTWHGRWAITLIMTAILIAASLAIPHLQSEVRMESFFKSNSEFTNDYQWYEKEFSPPHVSELMISFPQPLSDIQLADKFDYIDQFGPQPTRRPQAA